MPILIKIDSQGPVFADTPKRVGQNEGLFKMYKFRSMICNAHQLLKQTLNLKRFMISIGKTVISLNLILELLKSVNS